MPTPDKNEKALLVGLLIIILVVLLFFSKNFLAGKGEKDANPKKTSQDEGKKLTPMSDSDMAKMIIERKPVIILDLRDIESYKAEHIINSKNVSAQDLTDILLSSDKNKTYVIVDYTGENSTISLPDSISKLQNVYSLQGGFEAWKKNHNATISAGDPSSFSDQSKVSYISCDDLKKMIDSNLPGTYIIDVRGKDLFSQGHLKNATNILLDSLENSYRSMPLGKKIVVYDDNGFYAFQAAVRLFDLGVMNVSALSEGLDMWKQKGFEVTK
jgi:thiosulfate sulfurtransferase